MQNNCLTKHFCRRDRLQSRAEGKGVMRQQCSPQDRLSEASLAITDEKSIALSGRTRSIFACSSSRRRSASLCSIATCAISPLADVGLPIMDLAKRSSLAARTTRSPPRFPALEGCASPRPRWRDRAGGAGPHKRADGRLLWLKWEVRPWRAATGSIGGIRIFTEDVTAPVEMERALRESREDLDRAQAVARTGSWRLDVNRNNLTWSAETFRIFGISPDTLLTYEASWTPSIPMTGTTSTAAGRRLSKARLSTPSTASSSGKKIKWVRGRAELEFDGSTQGSWRLRYGTGHHR